MKTLRPREDDLSVRTRERPAAKQLASFSFPSISLHSDGSFVFEISGTMAEIKEKKGKNRVHIFCVLHPTGLSRQKKQSVERAPFREDAEIRQNPVKTNRYSNI